MEIVKIKIDDSNHPGIESLISNTLFEPTIQKISNFIKSINKDKDLIYTATENVETVGLLIISKLEKNDYEIKCISVDEKSRGMGIGRELIFHFQNEYPENRIIAETDDDAVDFYHKIGFKIESLGNKFVGVERYKCILDHYDWIPFFSYNDAFDLLKAANIPCWIAGGWALDLFHGKQTREHSDIDIVIKREDQLKLENLFKKWEMYHTKAPGLKYWDGISYLKKTPNIWLRENKKSPWKLEILFIDIEGDNWIYRRDKRIQMDIKKIGLKNNEGVNYLSPEVQLLYKGGSSKVRTKDTDDLLRMLPVLPKESKKWLRESLRIQFPDGHAWIDFIKDSEQNT